MLIYVAGSPMSRTAEYDNIAPACRPCNASKRSKLVSEWKGRQLS